MSRNDAKEIPDNTQLQPYYLDDIFDHIQYYIEIYGPSFHKIMWLLWKKIPRSFVDANVSKICKIFELCKTSLLKRQPTLRTPSLPNVQGKKLIYKTMLADYMQGWLLVRVIDGKKNPKKPSLFWATLDGTRLYTHRSVASSHMPKPVFTLTPNSYVNKHLADNTFVVFVSSTPENRQLNNIFKQAKCRVQFELTAGSELSVEMWINAFNSGINATITLDESTLQKDRTLSNSRKSLNCSSTGLSNLYPFCSLASNSWNHLSPTNPMRAAADDICQWSILAQVHDVDIGDGYGTVDWNAHTFGSTAQTHKLQPRVICFLTLSIKVNDSGQSMMPTTPLQSKSTTETGTNHIQARTEANTTLLGEETADHKTQKIHQKSTQNHEVKFDEALNASHPKLSSFANDKNSDKVKRVAQKILERRAAKASKLNQRNPSNGDQRHNSSIQTSKSIEVSDTSSMTTQIHETWMKIAQTHAVPLRPNMNWGASILLELPRHAISSAEVRFTLWCVEVSGKLSSERNSFYSSIDATPKNKNSRPYILTRYTIPASELLQKHMSHQNNAHHSHFNKIDLDSDAKSTGTTNSASTEVHLDKTETINSLNEAESFELIHNCSSAVLSLRFVDMDTIHIGRYTSRSHTPVLQYWRKTQQAYQVILDASKNPWPNIPTSFVSQISFESSNETNESEVKSSNGGRSSPNNSGNIEEVGKFTHIKSKYNESYLTSGSMSTKQTLLDFYCPYQHGDASVMLKRLAVSKCSSNPVGAHSVRKRSTISSNRHATSANDQAQKKSTLHDTFPFCKTIVLYETCLTTHLTYLVPWRYLEFRIAELTKNVQSSRDRYTAWINSPDMSKSHGDEPSSTADIHAKSTDVESNYQSGKASLHKISKSPRGSDATTLFEQTDDLQEHQDKTSWIQWIVSQSTNLAQLVQDYHDNAARYRHMLYRFSFASHADLLNLGKDSHGDTKADRQTIERSPFRRSIWKDGYGGLFHRHVAINCQLQSLYVNGMRHHPLGETTAVTWGSAADHVGGFKHGGLYAIQKRIDELEEDVQNFLSVSKQLHLQQAQYIDSQRRQDVNGGDGNSDSTDICSQDKNGKSGLSMRDAVSSLDPSMDDHELASASRVVADGELERLRCEREHYLEVQLKRRDVCMAQIWTVVLTAFLDNIQRLSMWKIEEAGPPTSSNDNAGSKNSSSLNPLAAEMMDRMAHYGFLIMFESLLSCWAKEKGMLEDLFGATRLLRRCTIEIVCLDQKSAPNDDGLDDENKFSNADDELSAKSKTESHPLKTTFVDLKSSCKSINENEMNSDHSHGTSDAGIDYADNTKDFECVDAIKTAADDDAPASKSANINKKSAKQSICHALRSSVSFYRYIPEKNKSSNENTTNINKNRKRSRKKHSQKSSSLLDGLEQHIWETGLLCARVSLPRWIYERLTPALQQTRIRVRPVIFTQGINEMHNMANVVGSLKLQKLINREGFSALKQYYKDVTPRCDGLHNENNDLGLRMHVLSLEACVLEQVESSFMKHYRILLIAADIVRALGGCRACNCKSGKDRTSMSITLEQARFTARHLGLTSTQEAQIGPWEENLTLYLDNFILLTDDAFNSFFIQRYRSISLAVRFRGVWMTFGCIQLTMLRPWEKGFSFQLCNKKHINQLTLSRAKPDDYLEFALFGASSEQDLQHMKRGVFDPTLLFAGAKSKSSPHQQFRDTDVDIHDLNDMSRSGTTENEARVQLVASGCCLLSSILRKGRTSKSLQSNPSSGVVFRAPLQLSPNILKLFCSKMSLDPNRSVVPSVPTISNDVNAALKSIAANDAYLAMSEENCFVEFACNLDSSLSLRLGNSIAMGDPAVDGTPTELGSLASIFRAHGVRIANARQNIGKSKFAFNSLQRKVLPRCYSPPAEVAKGGHKS